MRDFLKQHIDSTNEAYEAFMALSSLKIHGKNEFLLEAGQSVKTLFFIKKGIVRGYRLINGSDVTHHFFVENWFATDYAAYLTGETGELFLEALTETECYAFSKQELLDFYKRHPEFEKLRYIQAEDAYLQMAKRYKEFQTKDLKERYLQLITKNPELFAKVPQKYIASYLGVRPQSLSRIKETIKSVIS